MTVFSQAELKGTEQKLIDIRRQLHAYPELGLEEFKTTEAIRGFLAEKGIALRATKMETGVFADIGDASRGPTVAVRADMDALPVREQTGLPYDSKNDGVMHACGHDFHMAAAIGAAFLLKSVEESIPGRVRFLFQPSEEINDGALRVIADGQLEGVDAVIGLHNKPDIPVGTVGIKKGAVMAAVDRFHVVVRGKGCHGALPHKGRDPVAAAAQLISSAQSIVSRNISPSDAAVVSFTRINGGSAWNVIPEEVVMEGTTRAFSADVREQIRKRLTEIAELTAAAYGQTAEVTWIEGPPPVSNDSALAEIVGENSAGFLEVTEPQATFAGEDFAYYHELAPCFFAFFGVGGTEDWHHPKFTIDESAVILGAHFFASNAIALLKNIRPQRGESDEYK